MVKMVLQQLLGKKVNYTYLCLRSRTHLGRILSVLVFNKDHVMVLYSTANDPRLQMIPRPEINPKLDNKPMRFVGLCGVRSEECGVWKMRSVEN